MLIASELDRSAFSVLLFQSFAIRSEISASSWPETSKKGFRTSLFLPSAWTTPTPEKKPLSKKWFRTWARPWSSSRSSQSWQTSPLKNRFVSISTELRDFLGSNPGIRISSIRIQNSQNKKHSGKTELNNNSAVSKHPVTKTYPLLTAGPKSGLVVRAFACRAREPRFNPTSSKCYFSLGV